MQVFKILKLPLLLTLLLVFGCQKEQDIIENVEYDNVIYEVDTVAIYHNNLEKTREKTANQYVSILYNDLFHTAIPSNEMNDLSSLTMAIGDKQMASELTISSYMNDPQVKVPTEAEMRADPDAFIETTYLRFYLRKPTELEKYYFENLIENNQDVTPEIIYTSFVLSEEYRFY